MRGVIYARYSCDKQREESIEGQLRECRQFAKTQGIDIVNEYIDRAYSATTDQRPAFQRMISDSYLNRFDAVIVWKSDRFSRNRRQAMAYRDILKENNVKLLSATEPNIEGPAGILFESMNDGYNEYYIAEMKVKMKRGEKENVLEGKINGGAIPFGFKRTGKYTWEVNEDEAKTVRYVFDMYANTDLTVNGLVQLLKRKGLFNRKGEPFRAGSIGTMLSNRKYIGEYHWGEVSNNCLPAIVDKEIFEKVQANLKANQRKPQSFRSEEQFLLSGNTFCGECGSLVIGESGTSRNGNVYYYYKCSKAKHKAKTCSMKPIRKEILEDYVLFRATEFLNNESNIDRLAEEIQKYQFTQSPLQKELEESIGETSRKMDNLMKAIEAGLDPTDIKPRYNELMARRTELEHSLDEEKCKNPVMDIEDIKLLLSKCRGTMPENESEKKMLVDLLIKSIVIHANGDIDIFYNFRENKPCIHPPLLSSTTKLGWCTIKQRYSRPRLGGFLSTAQFPKFNKSSLLGIGEPLGSVNDPNSFVIRFGLIRPGDKNSRISVLDF